MREKRRPRLGQHFLSSPRYQRKIIEALPLRGNELVVEVGPGTGAMTGWLAEEARQVVAVEVDRKLADDLQERFRDRKNIEIRHGDILECDPGEVCRDFHEPKCFVFGNLPYHISSPFLQHIFGFTPFLSGMGLLLQYEVAGRIGAAPGRRAYGFLSVLTQYYSRPKLLWKVPPRAFAPPPQVESAFMQFEFPGAGKDDAIEDEEAFLISSALASGKSARRWSTIWRRPCLAETSPICLPNWGWIPASGRNRSTWKYSRRFTGGWATGSVRCFVGDFKCLCYDSNRHNIQGGKDDFQQHFEGHSARRLGRVWNEYDGPRGGRCSPDH